MPAKKTTSVEATREALRPQAPKKMKIKLPKFPKPPITAWSLSRIKLYEKCPLQFRLKHLEKLPEAGSPAMDRGDRIHKDIERYVRNGLPLPADIHAKLMPNIKWLRAEFLKRNINPEGELAYDRDWKPTSWFGSGTYLRVKIDALYLPKKAAQLPLIIDYKTGKIREGEYDDTYEIYGMAGLASGLGEAVDGQLWFTDHGEIARAKTGPVKLSQLPKLQKKWDARVEPMLNDKVFSPRPGDYCRWCTWSAVKGGPCVY